DPIVEQVRKRNKWDNDDYVCRGLILKVVAHNGFSLTRIHIAISVLTSSSSSL
ncbi:hypothetical protein Tco_0547222, partial [Tanacetum coccineum]